MPRAFAIASWVTCLLIATGLARAAEPSVPPVATSMATPTVSASSPRRYAFLDAPPPPLAELPPEPTREGDEYPRRAWEGFPSGGVGTPFCRGTAFGAGHCGDATTGATMGAGLLYRVSPYIAFGLDMSLVRFASRASSDGTAGGGTAGYSRATFIGLLVRGYLLDRGMLDPYVETGFGQATATAGYVDAGTEVRTESAAPSVVAGAGIDFWLAPYLRVGPALTYRIAWISDVRGCYASTCTTYAVDERGTVGSYATFTVRATIALGREM